MHVPGRDWAKVVICVADEKPIQAVLPAPLIVNLDRLLALAGARSIRLALEDELERYFPIPGHDVADFHGCHLSGQPPARSLLPASGMAARYLSVGTIQDGRVSRGWSRRSSRAHGDTSKFWRSG